MSIYRSPEGQREVAAWCVGRLDAWDVPHEREVLNTSLGSTHVVRAGSGEPVVLLPGTNFATATWLELVGQVARTHSVLAVDLPGQPGLSAAGRPGHSQPAYGDWLHEVVDALGATGGTVLAHSFGGAIALAGASRGARVGALVLVAPAGLVRLRVTPGVLARTLPWLVRPREDSARGLLRCMLAPGGNPPATLVTWMALVGRHVRTSLAPPPLSEAALREVRVPVAIVSGEADVFLPPEALRRGAARLPGATFRGIAGAGHLLPHERAEALLETVTAVERGRR
ncbi:alpha/beta hydrolase [Archangium violaceum]|uniref:alpha/beta fold hydrolase n=1 Tax=Archangium violaceum TaxID=83451 RepID=UPI00193C6812|nr:alpha/beta hydrolase [Archangium violaceum]QRK12553.1 alpha/beta hydrolase [Archangium violaceum]